MPSLKLAHRVLPKALDLALRGRVYPPLMARDGLLIGEVAARCGLSRKALRLYEARGILPKQRRAPSGYRVYPRDVLDVLHFVTQARRLGLTLTEIGGIIALRCAKPGPCVHVRALLERKLADLDGLRRRELRRILDSWDASSQRRGVVCQHIEGEGGDTPWRKSRSVPPVWPAQRSSWRARPSASARTSVVVLKKAEWNILVDVIKSGRVGRV
jgi:MerR family transcriptional regulator, copper efflux regulator